MQSAGGTLNTFSGHTDRAGHHVNSLKSKLEALRAEAGKRSGIGELAETLKGAGAVAGIAVIGELTKRAAEQAEELNKKWRAGKLDASGLVVEIGKSIPIIGGFVSAGQSIREMFTHEKEAIDDVNASIEAQKIAMEGRKKIIEDSISAQKEFNKEARGYQQETALLGTKGFAKEELKIQFEFENRGKHLDEQLAGDLKKAKDETAAAAAKMTEDMEKIFVPQNDGSEEYKTAKKAHDEIEGQIKGLTGTLQKQETQIKATYQTAVQELFKWRSAAGDDAAIEALNKDKEKVAELSKELKGLTANEQEAKLEGMHLVDPGQIQQAKELLSEIGKQKGIKKAAEDIKELKHQIDAFDESGASKAKEVAADGGTKEQQMQAQGLYLDLQKLKQAKEENLKADEDAKRIKEESRSPMDKYLDSVREVNTLVEKHKLTAAEATKAVGKAMHDLIEHTKRKVETSNALVAGSETAATFVAKFQAQGRENEHEKQLKEEVKKQSEYQRSMLHQLQHSTVVKVQAWNGGHIT